MTTNNLPIDYQCTKFLTQFLPIMIGINEYFISHWQNIGKTLKIGTMHWAQLVNHS